jgi:hypothetical protein
MVLTIFVYPLDPFDDLQVCQNWMAGYNDVTDTRIPAPISMKINEHLITGFEYGKHRWPCHPETPPAPDHQQEDLFTATLLQEVYFWAIHEHCARGYHPAV